MTSRKLRISTSLLAALALLITTASFALQPAPAEADGKWTELTKEKGVVVHTKEKEDGGLPAFRGVTTINASVYEILAVLNDVNRNTEWMANCREAKLIKRINDYEVVLYNRTKAPWPVDDRDVVLRSKVKVNMDKGVVSIHFRSQGNKHKGQVDGVVRMPRLNGLYRLKMISENKTRVTYQIDADPGGWLPDWLISKASSELPITTLTGLRKQVKNTRGQYAEFMKKWHPEQNGGKTLDKH